MTYRTCDHCHRTTSGTSIDVLRVRGWRIFNGQSITGKALRKIVCPYCAGTATEPEPTGWRVGCHTCDWEWEEDDVEGPLTEEQANDIASDHECEPETWVKSPDVADKPAERTGALL